MIPFLGVIVDPDVDPTKVIGTLASLPAEAGGDGAPEIPN